MSLRLPIYMDHNATTPMDRRVLETMLPFFCETFGNAASRGHSFGWAAEAAVDKARQQVAALIGGNPNAIVWTSGATESNNLAIKGVAGAYRDRGRHIISQATEHKAVIDPCKRLAKEGYDVSWAKIDSTGRVDPDEIRSLIRPDTILVSLMMANNEIGTLQPIKEIGAICREKGVLLHTDATQAVGKIPVDVEAFNIDLLSLTGHKLYGPKGCGAMYVKHKNPRVELAPILDGGGHERGYRSGTLNVPGIVGLGAACELAMGELPTELPRLTALRDRLENGIIEQVGGVSVNGNVEHRLPHMTNLSFTGVDADSMLMAMEDVAVSSGSACTSASLEPSYVLRAIGIDPKLAFSSFRYSLGRSTTADEVDYAIRRTAECIHDLRELAKLKR